MEGIVKEGSEALAEDMQEDTRDAAIIGADGSSITKSLPTARLARTPICWATMKTQACSKKR